MKEEVCACVCICCPRQPSNIDQWSLLQDSCLFFSPGPSVRLSSDTPGFPGCPRTCASVPCMPRLLMCPTVPVYLLSCFLYLGDSETDLSMFRCSLCNEDSCHESATSLSDILWKNVLPSGWYMHACLFMYVQLWRDASACVLCTCLWRQRWMLGISLCATPHTHLWHKAFVLNLGLTHLTNLASWPAKPRVSPVSQDWNWRYEPLSLGCVELLVLNS